MSGHDDIGFTTTEDRWGNRTYHINLDEQAAALADVKPGDYDCLSSTTWLKRGIPKNALIDWKIAQAAEAAVDSIPIVQSMLDAGQRNAAVDYLKSASDRVSAKSTDIGSALHDYAEALLWGWTLPEIADDVKPFVEGLEMFLRDWQPTPLLTERAVFHPRYGYGGRFDLAASFELARFAAICDWKTTKPGKQGHGIYAETALQISSYRHAAIMVDGTGARVRPPQVERIIGINIRPGSYNVVPLKCCDGGPGESCPTFRTFLYAQQIAKFTKEGQAGLVGNPMAPPIREAVGA